MRRMLITLAVAVLLAGAAVTSATGEDLEAFYRAYLAEKAEICAGKCCFLDSRSEALRRYAKDSLAKAAFLKAHRKQLIKDLITADAGKMPCKIDCLINAEFQNFLRQPEQYGAG